MGCDFVQAGAAEIFLLWYFFTMTWKKRQMKNFIQALASSLTLQVDVVLRDGRMQLVMVVSGTDWEPPLFDVRCTLVTG